MFLRKFLKLKKTLSFRLTVWYAVIFSLSSFMAFSIFYLKIYRITMSGVDKELVEKTQYLSASLIKAGPAQAGVVIGDEAKEEDQKDIFIRLVSRNGREGKSFITESVRNHCRDCGTAVRRRETKFFQNPRHQIDFVGARYL